jgi:DNA-binding CsgD family transcriptional regulator
VTPKPDKAELVESPDLTKREIEVVALLAEGKTNATIASELGIALKTVQNHLNHVFAKIEAPAWAEPRVYLAIWYRKRSKSLRTN